MITLRDYQQYIYNECQKAILNGSKGILVQLPCRAGKSYVFAKMVENLKRGYALIIAHRKELLKQHKKLFDNCHIAPKKYRFSSVFTEVNHTKEFATPTLIIIDEAHLSEAKSYKRVCESYPNALVIGFTATPQRLSGEKLSLYDTLIKGVSVQYLIDKGDISSFDYYAPNIGVDVTDVNIANGDYVVKELTDLMCKSKLYGDFINKYRELADGKQAIAYTVSVKHSKEIVQALIDNGIKAKEINGSTPNAIRESVIKEFKNGDIQILVNCNLISEGITLPEADVCLLLRPTQSLALFIQQSMRVLTPRKNKKAIIIDFVGNYQRHGLPNQDREWKLDGRVKAKSITDSGLFAIRSCEHCFRTYESKYTVCPYCGTPYVIKGRELEKVKEVEIKQIKADEEKALKETKKRMRMEVGKAKTIADLRRIAKERGYSNGWIFVQMRLKGIKS